MTNTNQPEDINARLESIDTRLQELGDEVDLIRTIQNANRRELRVSSQTSARLESTVYELSEIARLHQEGLRLFQQELRISQENAERDRQIFQAEIRRIWEYLFGQQGNGNRPQNQ